MTAFADRARDAATQVSTEHDAITWAATYIESPDFFALEEADRTEVRRLYFQMVERIAGAGGG